MSCSPAVWLRLLSLRFVPALSATDRPRPSRHSSKPPSLAAERYIKPRVLKQLLEHPRSADVLLDVRDASELEVCKLPGVVHIPLAELDGQLDSLSRDNTHYLICYAGTRAEQAATTLLAAGFANTKVLQGGMKHWVRDVEPDMPLY